MKESEPTPQKRRPFKVVRDIPPSAQDHGRSVEIPTQKDEPLTPETHKSILSEFQRIGFLGEKATSETDLITWHSFVKEYELGGMDPDCVVGRIANLRIVDEKEGIRTEIDTVVYNSHYRKADALEDNQRPRARMLLLVWPEPRDYDINDKIRVDAIVTDAGEMQFAVDPRVTEIADEANNAANFQKEIDRWGFPVELRQGRNDQKGILTESGGQKFAEQLKKFDEKSVYQTLWEE